MDVITNNFDNHSHTQGNKYSRRFQSTNLCRLLQSPLQAKQRAFVTSALTATIFVISFGLSKAFTNGLNQVYRPIHFTAEDFQTRLSLSPLFSLVFLLYNNVHFITFGEDCCGSM